MENDESQGLTRDVLASDGYVGYVPRTALDLNDVNVPNTTEHHDAEHISTPSTVIRHDSDLADGFQEHGSNRDVIQESSHTSAPLVGSFVLLGVVLIAAITVLALVSTCKIGWCNMTDKSSGVPARYSFRTFRFFVPVRYVLAALTAGILGLLTMNLYALLTLRKSVGESKMAQLATYIRDASKAFMFKQSVCLAAFVVPIFILIGFGANFTTAGCYAFGVFLSVLTMWLTMIIAVRGNVRAAAATEESIFSGLRTAFKSSAVVSLSVVSIGLAGVSFSYLVFRDVRALAGFAVGAATTALFARVGGGIFAKATDLAADVLARADDVVPKDDPRSPATIADKVGDNVGNITATGADLFESFVAAIIFTAILGASLPYFQNNPYAMCVYNNVRIDRDCVGYESPGVKVSFAASICRLEKGYTQYPSLDAWASNSLFIALPFLVAMIGLLSGIICTALPYIPTDNRAAEQREKPLLLQYLLWPLRQSVGLSSLLIFLGSAGLCFGLFGGASIFLSHKGMGVSDVPRFALSSSGPERCRPGSFVSEQETSDLPLGGLRDSFYIPIDSLGHKFPPPSEVQWRLFTCIVIGIVLGMAIEGFTEYINSDRHSPVKGIAAAGENAGGCVILRGLEIGMLSTGVPIALVFAAVLGSHALFGPYGIGLTAVAMLSLLGITMAMYAYGPISDNANSIAKMAEMSPAVRDKTDTLKVLGSTMTATGKAFSNLSAVLVTYAMLGTLIQNSGFVRSPFDIAGTQTISPSRHITDVGAIGITNVYVVVSLIIGVTIPAVYGAVLLIAIVRSSLSVIAGAHRQFNENPELTTGSSDAPRDYKVCIKDSIRSAMFEMVVPCIIAVLCPLVIGFGLGQRSLVAFLLGAIGSGSILGSLMSNSGGAWATAKQVTEFGYFSKERSKKYSWYTACIVGEQVGQIFKDTVGPSIAALSKSITVLGFIAVPLMKPGTETGWIGLIILIAAISCAIGFAVLSALKAPSLDQTEPHMPDENGSDTPQVSMTAKSPFYEDGPKIVTEHIAPGSQLHRALEAVEGDDETKYYTNVLELPGIKFAET